MPKCVCKDATTGASGVAKGASRGAGKTEDKRTWTNRKKLQSLVDALLAKEGKDASEPTDSVISTVQRLAGEDYDEAIALYGKEWWADMNKFFQRHPRIFGIDPRQPLGQLIADYDKDQKTPCGCLGRLAGIRARRCRKSGRIYCLKCANTLFCVNPECDNIAYPGEDNCGSCEC